MGNFQYRILEYNTIPVAEMNLSPCQLFYGRLLKTRLPVSRVLLYRNTINEENVQDKLENKREKQKYYYDRTAKNRPILNKDDNVMFKKNCTEWVYGKVKENVNDRSYILEDSLGNQFRRNKRVIKKTKNSDINISDLLYENNEECKGSLAEPERSEVRETETILEESNVISHETSDSSDEIIVEDINNSSPIISEQRTRSGRVVRQPKKYIYECKK